MCDHTAVFTYALKPTTANVVLLAAECHALKGTSHFCYRLGRGVPLSVQIAARSAPVLGAARVRACVTCAPLSTNGWRLFFWGWGEGSAIIHHSLFSTNLKFNAISLFCGLVPPSRRRMGWPCCRREAVTGGRKPAAAGVLGPAAGRAAEDRQQWRVCGNPDINFRPCLLNFAPFYAIPHAPSNVLCSVLTC